MAAPEMTLDIFLTALAAQVDLPGLGHATCNRQYFLLRGLDLTQTHGALRLQVFLEHFLFEDIVGTLQREDQRIGRDLAQQRLYTAVVDLFEIVEHEHEVLDALREIGIDLLDRVHHVRALGRVHEIEDVRSGLAAADRGRLHVVVAGELPLEDLVELLERARMHALEARDAHQYVGAQPVRKQGQDLRGVIAVEIGEDDGDDLRVLEPDDLGHRARVHPLERLEALARRAGDDAIHEIARLFIAERRHLDIADVVFDTAAERGLIAHGLDELAPHRLALRGGDVIDRGHREAELLHLLGREVFHDLGRGLLTHRHQQYGRALHAPADAFTLSHRSPPNSSRPARRAWGPGSRGSAPC